MNAKPSLLIVDDDPLITESLQFMLHKDFAINIAATRGEAIDAARRELPSVALVDLGLPPQPHLPEQGFHLISDLLIHSPAIKILVLSGQNGHSEHIRSLGALELIEKPCSPLLIKSRLHLAIQGEEHSRIRLVGNSTPMESLRREIGQYAAEPFPVLVCGESGSGKELVAKSLHLLSERAHKPYLTLNCAALSPSLIESALFGHSKGAFTGASACQGGFFEEAGNGTLFLDEIGELPLDLQAKLLRVLENGEYQRVGETRPRTSQARVIAATNRDLRQEIIKGGFRADLYHRINVFCIHVPPLRSLGDDRKLLLEHFRRNLPADKPPFILSEEALERIACYSFPGNIRELRNIVVRLQAKYPGRVVSRNEIEAELDSETATEEILSFSAARRHLQGERDFNLDATLRRWEKKYIDGALELTHGNMSAAAKLLGLSRTTLYGRMDVKEGRM